MRRRACGILLHLTSLPAQFGVGDMGPWARKFGDFLASAGQSAWQVLPIGPTSGFIGNSPYSSFSAFAGNPLLVSPEDLLAEGWLTADEVAPWRRPAGSAADYGHGEAAKAALLRRAFERRRDCLAKDPEFAAFLAEHGHWLTDYALFVVIKTLHGGAVWNTWPAPLRDREPAALEILAAQHAEELLFEEFRQFVFFRQWKALRHHLDDLGVRLIGDAPIYVLLDSADVWANPGLFKLDEDKQPLYVAGVPPDYFSETGQLWGNPVYDWPALAHSRYEWWVQRVAHNVALYDLVRIDHFRGFAGYWEVPAGEETAINGEWVDAPGMDLFETLSARLPTLPVIAEDLGVITPDVRELRDSFGFPGMKILQFAFGPGLGRNPDAPHNYPDVCVAYTGTHDNNTTRGWFQAETDEAARARLSAYAGCELHDGNVARALIRLVFGSVAKLAMVPLQDWLNLEAWARMNKPSLSNGNWSWRVEAQALHPGLAAEMRELAELFGRA